MPVIYSFTTVLDMPLDEDFECAAIGEAEMPHVLSIEDVEASRGAPHFSIDGNNDLVIYSDDGTLSQLRLDLPLGEKHTFETTFIPDQLPLNLSDIDNYRFFIGTYDRQDNASGVLISRDGIALVAYFGTRALVIPGSQGIFEEGTQYTLRLVVDGDANLMYLYVTETTQVVESGHTLRYTSAAPTSEAGELDAIRIEIIGQSDRTITGKFSTFLASCTKALIPNRPPIAVAGNDQTANVGSAVVHDGRGSYDPEGEQLSYDWKLKDAPDGSRYKVCGTGGSTIDDGDTDGFTNVFDGGTGAFSVTDMPLLQPGDHLLVGGLYYQVSTVRWELDADTGKYARETGGSWDDDTIVINADTLPDDLSGEAWCVLHSDTYFSDRSQGYPSAIPDKVGIYMVGLIVNDGELDSIENEALLNVASTSIVIGCTPDVSWTWGHLSDFWNLLEDREIVETVWSGFAQACAAQLLTAWQIDYNKSLLDIQRVFQRRWLEYSTILDEEDPDAVTIRINTGGLFSIDLSAGADVDELTLQLVLDADSIQTVVFTGTLTASQIADSINDQMGFGDARDKLARVKSEVRSKSPLVGGAVFDTSNTLNGEEILLAIDEDARTVTFDDANPVTLDEAILEINSTMAREVAYESDSAGVKTSGGGYLAFDMPGSIVQLLNKGAADDATWTDLGFAARIGEPEYLVLEHGTLLRIRPGGTANSVLGFSTTAYTNNGLSGTGAAISASKLESFEAATPALIDFTVQGVTKDDLLVVDGVGYRIQKVALDSATGTIRRGLTLTDALPDDSTSSWTIPSVVVSETINFTDNLVVAGDLVRFSVKNETTGEFTEVLCEVVGAREYRVGFDPQPLLEHYAGVPSNYTTEFLGIKHLTYIPVDGLVVEIPRLQEVIKDPSSELDQNLDFYVEDVTVGSETVRAVRFKDDIFTLLDPPPDDLWAEVTYLDNRPTIEANFGRLVNFTVEDMEARTDELDYLSAVRGLWWSYFGGPAVSKVKTGVQILLGLPFSEVEGIIQDIEHNFSALEGRITIQDAANEDVVRTYFYPKSAGLAVNAATGATLAEGDAIAQFHPLSGGVEVADWVSDADWMARYVSQGKYLEIEKYFKWLIRADVDTFSLANLIFAVDFAKKITPHYTTNLFVLLKNLASTEVDITDSLEFKFILDLFDTFCSSEASSYNWDATDESGSIQHDYDESPSAFYDKNRLCPSEDLWVYISYTHAGGSGWDFDTVWAYDDGDDDRLPLSGPATADPPYGPLVGTITFDDTVTAGVYTRGRTL